MKAVAFVVALALGLGLVTPSPASAEQPGASFKGRMPPELGPCEWVQGGPIEGIRSLRGRVVLLHFFGSG